MYTVQKTNKCTPEIHPLWRTDLNDGSNEERPMRRERNYVAQNAILHIYDLQNIAGSGTKPRRILDDKELFFLRSPEQPPRTRKRRPRSDRIAAKSSNFFDGFNDLRAIWSVFQGFEASLFVWD